MWQQLQLSNGQLDQSHPVAWKIRYRMADFGFMNITFLIIVIIQIEVIFMLQEKPKQITNKNGKRQREMMRYRGKIRYRH